MEKTIANPDPAKVISRASECLRRLMEAGLSYEDLQKPIDNPEMRQRLVRFWQTGAPIPLAQYSSSNALSDLFDRQIENLRNRGCPDQVLAMLIRQKPQVLVKVSAMTFKKNRIPFLPIIPFSLLNLSIQTSMVRNDNWLGFTNLDANEIKDIVSTPHQPYYIFDVEDGKDMLGRSVLKATELIKSQDRSPLTAAEVISLGIQTDALSKRYVDAGGSRSESDDGAPHLALFVSQPKLNWNFVDYSSDRCGSASCGSRS